MTEHDINETPEERLPRRVGGTPSPAESSSLLGTAEGPPGRPDDERSARGAERIVALLFAITFLAGVAFIAAYLAFQVHTVEKTLISNYALGGTLTLALFALAAGITIWARSIMPKTVIVQERHPMASDAETKREFTEHFLTGAEESGIAKRPLLRRSLLAAAVPLGLAPLILLKDLGPLPRKKLLHTSWTAGRRLVMEGTGTPIRAEDFNSPGGILSVVPEGFEHNLEAIAKSAVVLIKFRPDELKAGVNKNWAPDGIVAYSKICTHVGCPAALYEQDTHHILCPCHQSTFDAADGAKVIFGPAARPLPQLPIGIKDGYLVALSDFKVPVGPSFWERGDAEAKVGKEGQS